jgi:signal transduction histidine kinase
MNKGIFLNFIKDRFIQIIGYFFSIGLILLYCYLTIGFKDWRYPLALAIFIFLIIYFIDWSRYYRFYGNIRRDNVKDQYNLNPITNEQRDVSDAIQRIHSFYSKDISRIKMEETNRQHLLSQWIHNMKTPISVIGLILQKVKIEKLLDENYIKDIEEENSKLNNGLEQILNLMRVEEFFRDYEPGVVNVIADLRELINNRKNQFIYNNVFPKLNISKEQCIVITDSKWNRFMLDQIISNAIKYSHSNGVKKYVTFTVKKSDTKTMLEIEDEGVGIPEYDLKRIFEPFFTGDNGRKYRDSSGIGLYISSLIADKLGHEINVESQIGQGTKVTITYVTKM